MSSITTSDTEAGLPGGRLKETRFSLYSTDTEEQVASVNRGLDRCAALLDSLLCSDSTTELSPQQHRAPVSSEEQLKGNEPIHRHGDVEKGKSLSSKLKTQTDESSRPLATQSTGRLPSEGRYMRSHPHASSTPVQQRDKRHVQSNAEPRGNKPMNEVSGAVQSKPTRAIKPKTFDGEYTLPRKPLAPSDRTCTQALDKSKRLKGTGENVTKIDGPKSRKRLQATSGKPFNTLNRKQRNVLNSVPSRVPTVSTVSSSSRHKGSTPRPVITTAVGTHSKSQPRPPCPKLISNPLTHPSFGYPFLPTYPYFSPYPSPSTTPASAPWTSTSTPWPSTSTHWPLTSVPWPQQLPTGREPGTNEEGVLPPHLYPPFYPTPLINGWYPVHHQQSNTNKLKDNSTPHTSLQTQSAEQRMHTRSTSGGPITVPSHHPSDTVLPPSSATAAIAGAPKASAFENHTGPTMSSRTHLSGVYAAMASSEHQTVPVSQAAKGRPNTGKALPNRAQKLAKDAQKRCKSAPPAKVSHEDYHNERSSPGKMEEILNEMQTSISESVSQMKRTCQEGDSVLVRSVVHLENTVNMFCSRLHQESQRSLKDNIFPSQFISDAHWLEEIQLLESEKSQLLQRIIASESAYSAVMGELEQARKEKSLFHYQVDAHREELNSLRDDLQNAKDLLTQMNSQNAITKEEYNEMRTRTTTNSETNSENVEAQNEHLKKQVQSLETELALSKQECLSFTEQLSILESSVDSTREELQLIRDTITEKDTQLLCYQDQLLGLRQCLACFLSKLRRVGSCKSCDCHMFGDVQYHVPLDIVKELQSLVNDGNIEKFIAGQYRHDLLQPDPNESCRSSIDGQSTTGSDSTLTEGETREVQKSKYDQRGELSLSMITSSGDQEEEAPTSSSTSNSVITPLNVSGVENFTPKRTHTMNIGDDVVDDDRTPSSSSCHSFSSLSQVSATFEQPGSKSLPQETLQTNSRPIDHFQQLLPATGTGGVLYGRGPSPQTSVTSRGIDTRSSVTTSSEIEFRKDLASLDDDIARLQIQFRVALQTQ